VPVLLEFGKRLRRAVHCEEVKPDKRLGKSTPKEVAPCGAFV